MRPRYRYLFASLMITSLLLLQSIPYAWGAGEIPDAFSLTVTPNPLAPSVAADLTIKAVQADGTVVAGYKGTVIIDLENFQDANAYDMPSDGVYAFTAEDQWIKTFSKWLIIKKSWTFTIKAFDIANDAIQWSSSLVVWSGPTGDALEQQLIEIVSPASGSVVSASALNLIGKSDSKRVPLQFFIDGQKVFLEGETDALGNFSVYLPGVSSWPHTIQAKIVDYQGNIIGVSPMVGITYEAPATDAYLKSFTVTPDGTVNAGDQVVIAATVQDTVRSVEIRFGDMGLYPLERQGDGTFTKTIIADVPGVQKIDATLIFDGGQRTDYPDRATLNVVAVDGVSMLKAIADPNNPQRASLSWVPQGNPASYVVRYGTSPDALSSEAKSISPSTTIDGLQWGTYAFQVFAVDANGLVVGKWSDIVMLQNVFGSAPTTSDGGRCTVVGIKVKTEKIGDQYYLMRDSVPWATEYNIYRSDFVTKSVDEMQKVGTSPIAQFAYPFDASASHDQYAYYAVTATCADGTTLQIDNIKKVHVWPVSDMLTMILICLFCYSLYRLYRMAR